MFPPAAIALGFVTGFAICAFSMVVNDYYDIEVDRVNQPTRPLPSGQVSKKGAIEIAALMLVVGFAATALLLDLLAVLIVALYSFLAWLYDFRAKKYGLAGNLIVASSLADPFHLRRGNLGGTRPGLASPFHGVNVLLAGVGQGGGQGDGRRPGRPEEGGEVVRERPRAEGGGGAGALFFLGAVVTSLLPLLAIPVSTLYRIGVVLPDAAFVYLAYRILTHADVKGALSVRDRPSRDAGRPHRLHRGAF